MTHTKDEALALALEALKFCRDNENYGHTSTLEAIAAIKQALAAQPAPVQEPEHIVHSNGRYSPLLTRMMNKRVESNVKQVIHLYDEPPAAPVEPMAHIVGEIDHTGKVWKPVQPAPMQVAGPSGDCLSDFQEGQWWVAELDAVVASGTHEQKRAMAVVRNLLATVAANTTPPAAPIPDAIPDAITDNSESVEYRAGWNECRQTMMEMMK
jgi:hypothetical protein